VTIGNAHNRGRFEKKWGKKVVGVSHICTYVTNTNLSKTKVATKFVQCEFFFALLLQL